MTKMRKMKLGRLSVGAIASVLFALALLVPQAVSAAHVARVARQSAVERAVDSLIGVRTFHEVAVSPDGSKVAWSESLLGRDKAPTGNYAVYVADFRSPSAAPRVAGPTQPTAPDAGVIEEHVDEQRLTIVDPAIGAARQVSPPDMYVYEYDWSPDSRSFALTAAHGSGDNNWFVAQLYTMSAETGVLKSLLKPTAQIAEPHWSPDARQVAFVGGLMSDEGVTGGDIYTVAASGGEAKNLTPGMKASASQIAWT